jgi:hypothetical protein
VYFISKEEVDWTTFLMEVDPMKADGEKALAVARPVTATILNFILKVDV